MRGSKDVQVLDLAIEENRIIITNDVEFGSFVSKRKPPGILLLRLHDEHTFNKIAMLEHVLRNYVDRLYGNLVVVTERRIRIRPL